jgi:hypothetical protein
MTRLRGHDTRACLSFNPRKMPKNQREPVGVGFNLPIYPRKSGTNPRARTASIPP